MPNADLGTGATITGTTFFAEILDISHNDITRAWVDTSHMGTTAEAMTGLPGDLYNPGTWDVEFQFDPDVKPDILSTTGNADLKTITLTFPIRSGRASGATWAASGAMTSFSYGVPLEDKMTGTATINFSGPITITASTT